MEDNMDIHPHRFELNHKSDQPSRYPALTAWIGFPDPAEFIQGRRDWTGHRGQTLTDDEILPDIFELDDGCDNHASEGEDIEKAA
jgi:hypothetical protein